MFQLLTESTVIFKAIGFKYTNLHPPYTVSQLHADARGVLFVFPFSFGAASGGEATRGRPVRVDIG